MRARIGVGHDRELPVGGTRYCRIWVLCSGTFERVQSPPCRALRCVALQNLPGLCTTVPSVFARNAPPFDGDRQMHPDSGRNDGRCLWLAAVSGGGGVRVLVADPLEQRTSIG